MTTPSAEDPIRLGVSECLLGHNVRFDGGHARDRFVTDVLDPWVEYVPVCPEVEVGMGTPRPSIRLTDQGDGRGVRLVSPATGEDFTDAMRTFSQGRVEALKSEHLDGYILKRRSPSCGMERLPIYRGKIRLPGGGVGVFAEALMSALPGLPVEEDGRLNDAPLRENFIERIFCRFRWRQMAQSGLTRGKLVGFHTQHKLLLLSHNQAGYRRLGSLVGSMNKQNEEQVFAEYEVAFQACLSHKATIKRHVNVLQHAMGYLKRDLSTGDKHALLSSIDDFRLGLVPLIVPTTLLRFNIQRFDITYLADQLYFSPHPKELMLRNHC
jgi:uncharacterized protein YbgA (DUF1722 family)/uncharacterized protein YbbK (DUF523 family)